MDTETTWKKYFAKHKGVYSSGHSTDRTDPDGIIANEYFIVYREAILSFADKNKTAVELGCGNQPIFDALNKFGDIYYTDISPEALDAAEKEFENIKKTFEVTSNVHFKEMSVDKFDFEDESLDVVFNTRAPHRDETSEELFRTLKEGGSYIYQTIGEKDFEDFKLLFKGGRFYEDYLKKNLTQFDVIKKSLEKAGFLSENIKNLFDKKFKSYFENKNDLKERLWLLVGDYDFDLPENDKIIDEYISTHKTRDGKIYVENHRLIVQVIR